MSFNSDSLVLYHLTLKTATLYISSIIGSFYGKRKSQELVLTTNTSIELWQPDPSSGVLKKISQQQTFGVIQSIVKLSTIGGTKDKLVITSDSGKLVILEFDNDKKLFIPIVQEPHSKNGIRRISPGEYMCIDPQNRAIMISAIEKNKLVYKVQISSEEKIELSSPLEAVKKSNITFNIIALDTGYENPIFAAIECDYSLYSSRNKFDIDNSPLQLNYYELDQGLNHLVRNTSQIKLPSSSSHMIALPYPIGGVLIACRSFLIYDHPSSNPIFLPIPIRKGSKETVIISHVVHKLKKDNFFVLIQSTLGDLFKLSVDFDLDKELINNISITYFDTIPECIDISIFKSGFLFANVKNNDKLLYQFEKLGEEDRSTLYSNNFSDLKSVESFSADERTFTVKGLENLALVFIVETFSPIVQSNLLELSDSYSSDPLKGFLTLSSQAYVKSLIHGFLISTIVESPLPITPTDIFTTKLFSKSLSDEYLVISSSLSSKTLVLSIGEVVEEVEDSKFITDQATLTVQQVGVSSVIQIYGNGIRHIKHANESEGSINKLTTDWKPPKGVTIVQAAANHHQVVIALSNRELCYFEIDQADDQLIEYQDRSEMPGAVLSLGICNSHKKSNFCVVECSGEIVQVISLKPHNCLVTMSMQALSSNATSILLLLNNDILSVHIGMDNGLYVRTLMDEVNGKLSDTQTRYLGSKPVRLSLIELLDEQCILAISSRPWIGHFKDSNVKLTSLIDCQISTGSAFVSEDIGEKAIVGIDGNNLVIFTVGKEDSDFSFENDFEIDKTKLRYNPKNMILDNSSSVAYVIESEYGVKGPFTESKLEGEGEEEEGELIDQNYYDVVGYDKVKDSWASCIQVVDYKRNQIIQSIELTQGSCALSICCLKLDGNQDHVVVGVTENKRFTPSSYSGNYLYTFKVTKEKRLQFLHKTELDKPPTAMIDFKGKLLVSMDNYLRLFSLGLRQLLRKSSSKIEYLKCIVKLVYSGKDRIIIGDSVNSMVFLKFDSIENKFIPIADDIMNRQITAMLSLDYYTVVGGDKFGNFFVSRLPETISKQSEGAWFKFQEPYLNASGARLKNLCEFYLHDIPTSFIKANLTFGEQEAIFYTGLQGTIGLFLPLLTFQEVEFLRKLEISLRNYFDYNFDDFDREKNGYNLLGKDHLKFRGAYNPVKNVIDGDLIERFQELKIGSKIKIANELDRSPREIETKIFELRNRSSF